MSWDQMTNMKTKENIFQKTYDDYLELIKDINLESISNKLGAKYEEQKIIIKLFNSEYVISAEGINGSSGQKPSYDICIILIKYILLCPEAPISDNEWVSYKNFKNSAPLVNFFSNEVEKAISHYFSEKLNDLKNASHLLAGYPSSLKANYDFSMQFDALPMVPIILLYNDSDEEFPATSSILFEAQAEKYLDCECLAMLGHQLFNHLKKAVEE
ncbi:MAG: DUF3786 domain-containing protein [Planctomycetota bacterium]|jgi:hypothetical protein